MRRAACLAALLALAACSPAADTPAGGPTPPADAPIPVEPAPAGPDLGKDINAIGTEPFWALEIRKTTLALSGPDRADLVVPHGGVRLQEGGAVVEGAKDGASIKAVLTVQACSDGMSDRTYPYAATVEVGGKVLKGCAAPVDALPPPE